MALPPGAIPQNSMPRGGGLPPPPPPGGGMGPPPGAVPQGAPMGPPPGPPRMPNMDNGVSGGMPIPMGQEQQQMMPPMPVGTAVSIMDPSQIVPPGGMVPPPGGPQPGPGGPVPAAGSPPPGGPPDRMKLAQMMAGGMG